jgi:antitoxin component of RelBE/YafQ-DinJ toxin-antitoxin module
MPQITINVSDQALKYLSMASVTPDQAVEYAARLIKEEIPNNETLQAIEESKRNEGVYTAKDLEDLFRHLGMRDE